jgi:hypothetical protein
MNASEPELRRELAGLAAQPATLEERATAILEHLERILEFDAGWLAVADPEHRRHVPLATTGASEPLCDYFSRPEADDEVEALGLNRRRPPMLASEIPIPLSEVCAWAEHLLPAGFRQGLAVGLFAPDGRHLGFLSLLSADHSRPNHADRRLVTAVTTVITAEVDRTRDIAETAQIVESAGSGIVLTREGDVLPLPGLADDRLLAPGSPILTVVAEELAAGSGYVSFLARAGDAQGEQLIRVVALDVARPELDHLAAAVLLCPAGDLRGLTVLDLRVLGLLVEGVRDVPALAEVLHVTREAAAEAIARSLTALGTNDPAVATVRALRGGMRLPPGVG